ncbi:DUF4255 domain-containing protein [Amycolatopsis nigrescens]|uniref:DUF4255 domain-containing protein n=1 Tax=Amycolatopsis nigrescens TaxID=381445 RepID=UPI000377D443|nr:DUF4255 domain-containing protein [Amycolatopsis nigrescens]
MSNYLSIAQATDALCGFIARALLDDGITFGIRVTPRKPPAEPPADPMVTVFLYQITPNAALRNRDAPTRAPDGTLLVKPQAALDLHYLITCYGNEDVLEPQRMLGSIVRGLHEQPILSRVDIEESATKPFLAGADLASAPQAVRFTPAKLDLDDLSKLWSMLVQTPYALSVVYEATAVVVDGRGVPAAGKPVLRRTVRAIAGGRPKIERLLSRALGSPDRPAEGPVPAGSEVWLEGTALAGDGVVVRVGDREVTPSSAGEQRVVFTLPEQPAALPPGIYPVQVLHDVRVRDGAEDRVLRRVLESNAVPLVRQPRVLDPVEAGGDPPVLTIRLDLPLRASQRVEVLLDELDPPADRAAASYRFAAAFPLERPPGTEDAIRVPVPGVRPAVYLVRVQVDGVPSLPGPDLRTPTAELGA